MLLSEQAYRKIDRELTKFPPEQKRSAVMAALTIAQDEHGWVSPEIIRDVAQYLGQPPIAVQEVATFYNMYNTKPVGRYTLAICTNLPCALQDGVKSAEYLKEKLGIDFHETTADGLFTLVEGECMGACGDSPVMIVNGKHMCCRMQPEKIDALIGELKQESA
ncbi:NADH-quinone oxidoreductase subunit NuoE [Castellaniella sp. S9]|uniref:NADH-quinone oxidoreductase subunit NuoE n=1 Tax=Castellaniella sp. S9 TaxID=2993652 RepID=UPI0022B39CE5|nr:NADH-quinone oxidoreductase subunit NuoE [Castellaniella sp. S9]